MSQYNQNQPQVSYAYPAPSSTAAAAEGPYVVPPPVGYPMKDGQSQQPHNNQPLPYKTQSRGDGFWKGWSVLSLSLSLPHLLDKDNHSPIIKLNLY
ncbi:hypothetical protein ACSBR2_027413 [Camellia fascicularis]